MQKNEEQVYGPLQGLIGVWRGDKGTDIAPEPNGTEDNPYYEVITYSAIGDVTNAESQTLVALQYRQIVQRKSNHEIFHDQSGYWMWDTKAGLVMHAFAIPRGVCVLAGGGCTASENPGDGLSLEVHAKKDDPNWSIIQSPFMRDNALTTEFRQKITLSNNMLTYSQTTELEIYGTHFQHTDENQLSRH